MLEGRPSVGGLMELCDENYRQMLKLAPTLTELKNRHLSRVDGHLDLHLEILEQTPYTTLIHLTYRFGNDDTAMSDPDAQIRVYHDAKQLEVLDLKQRAIPMEKKPDMCSLERKWRANLFLSKWLEFCCGQKHHFSSDSELSSCNNPVVAA